jgi:hypothetical protein
MMRNSNRFSTPARVACFALSFAAVTCAAGTPSPDPRTADFERRCAHADVVRCVGFDHPRAIEGNERQPSGIIKGAADPTLDTTVKASGASSLKFTIPSNSPANTSGNYFTNFSDDLSVQFGEGQEFFIQWRQRFTKELITTKYRGAGGFKLLIVGTGDQPAKRYYACSPLEIVVNTYYHHGFPIVYNSCTGSTSHRKYDFFQEPIRGASGAPVDWKFQNARPAPGCLRSHSRSSYFPPNGNCFGYHPDEWMTFQLRVKLGPRVKDEFTNSFVTLWMARENRPSEPVVEWGPYNLTAGDPSENQRFGKVWLLPYNTGKDPAEVHPVAYTWYDELIISRSRIPDPRPVAQQ